MEKEQLIADASKDAEVDPFTPENVGAIQFIMLARIYDVLMGLYKEQNPEKARALLEQHLNGTIVGPSPYMNGKFVTDIINSPTA